MASMQSTHISAIQIGDLYLVKKTNDRGNVAGIYPPGSMMPNGKINFELRIYILILWQNKGGGWCILDKKLMQGEHKPNREAD